MLLSGCLPTAGAAAAAAAAAAPTFQRVRVRAADRLLTCLSATVQKIVGEILSGSSGIAFSKEARDVLIECCVEFITLISSEANEISEKETKKTIACDHIIKALDQLGFPDYVPAVLEAAAEHKEVQKVGKVSVMSVFFVPLLTSGNRDAKRRQINWSRAACPWRSWSVCSKSNSRRRRRGTTDYRGAKRSCYAGSTAVPQIETEWHVGIGALLGLTWRGGDNCIIWRWSVTRLRVLAVVMGVTCRVLYYTRRYTERIGRC